MRVVDIDKRPIATALEHPPRSVSDRGGAASALLAIGAVLLGHLAQLGVVLAVGDAAVVLFTFYFGALQFVYVGPLVVAYRRDRVVRRTLVTCAAVTVSLNLLVWVAVGAGA